MKIKYGSSKFFLIAGISILYIIFAGYMIHISKEKYNLFENIIYELVSSENIEDKRLSAATDALKGELDQKEIEDGKEILETYGYGEEYQSYIIKLQKEEQNKIIIVFLCSYLTMLVGILILKKIDRDQKNKEFLQMIEQVNQFISGDYSVTSLLNSDDMQTKLYLQLDSLGQKLNLNETRLIQEKEETKTLVTDISHQLKTPIASLKMCFSLLNDEKLLPEERTEFMKRLEEQMNHLEALTAALINISRLESGMISLQKENGKIFQTIVSAVNAVYLKAETKHITIELTETNEEIEQLVIPHDKKWTKEAIVNILENAIKYSDEKTYIQIFMKKQTQFLRIEIADEGIGIPKEEYNNIFKRFYRGKDERIRKEEGSGVGLYLTREILEAQGGTIMVVSNERRGRSHGSIFAIHLSLTDL